jgi:WD40 repeat protein
MKKHTLHPRIARPNLVAYYLARGSQDGTLSVSRIFYGQVLWEMQAHQGAITSLAWSVDGQLLASAGQDSMIHVWQAETGQCLSSFEQGTPVDHLQWSAHGQLFSSSGSLVQLWTEASAAVAA